VKSVRLKSETFTSEPRYKRAELTVIEKEALDSASFFHSPRGLLLYWIIGITGIMLAVMIMASAVRAETIKLQGAGRKSFDAEVVSVPFNGKESKAVRLREIARILEGSFSYDGAAKIVEITSEGKTARFLIDADRFIISKRGMSQIAGRTSKPIVLFRGASYIDIISVKTFLRQFHNAALKPLPGRLIQALPLPIRENAKPETVPLSVSFPNVPAASTHSEPAKLNSKLAPFIHSIVIDAGHGAHDPGAIGPSGLKEKDVNLDVAIKFGKHLSDLAAGKIFLTRNTDVFLSLKERVEFAKRHRADIFISIHSNSMSPPHGRTASGTEVYFFSAPSDNEARLAERLEGGPFDPKAEGIDPVLWDLMVAGNVVESHKLAYSVEDLLPSEIGLPKRGVKSARFYVMYYGVVSNIPSILVELGYISNPTEEAKLADAEWRDRAAKALASAVANYLRDLERRYPSGKGWSR